MKLTKFKTKEITDYFLNFPNLKEKFEKKTEILEKTCILDYRIGIHKNYANFQGVEKRVENSEEKVLHILSEHFKWKF